MSQHVHFEQSPPRSWDQFEELCADTFQEEWQDSGLVRHGRAGQAQHGVDIVGTDGADWPVGIQCKRKSVWPVTRVTPDELDKEVKKAKGFKPALKAFYLVSTAPDDNALQERARKITQRHKEKGLFAVSVIGWSELVRRATRHHRVATKHFGAYSTGPASPLLATWQASKGKLDLGDQELSVAIRELIHDLRDFPSGRFVFRQKESEDLLFQIKNLRAKAGKALSVRGSILDLRDKLKVRNDDEKSVVAGVSLLLGDTDLADYVRVVWDEHAPLLLRSFVEQEIAPSLRDVKALVKVRLRPPTLQDDPLAVYVSQADMLAIWEHWKHLKIRYPDLATDNVDEFPSAVKFGRVIPRIMRAILKKLAEGMSLKDLKRQKWLTWSAWKVEI